MPFDKDYFASKACGARGEKRMSQEEFGKAVGTNKNTIHDYETAKCAAPGADKIMAICEFTSKSPNEMLGWNPEEHPVKSAS